MARLRRYERLLLSDSRGTSKANSILDNIQGAAGSALAISAAGIAGAMVDESDHWGVRALLSLCASGTISAGRFASLQFHVLPTMVLAMAATAVLQMAAAAFFTGRRGLVGAASAHTGCVIGMWSSFLLCSRLLDINSGVGRNAILMVMTDTIAAVTASVVVVTAYRLFDRCCRPPAEPRERST